MLTDISYWRSESENEKGGVLENEKVPLAYLGLRATSTFNFSYKYMQLCVNWNVVEPLEANFFQQRMVWPIVLYRHITD